MRKISLKGKSGFIKGYRPKEQIFNCMWEFHSYDDDPSPSVPHGHSLDGKLKLSIWDGAVYDVRSKKKVGQASKKEIRKLKSNDKFKAFVKSEREWYISEHGFVPGISDQLHHAVSTEKLAEYKAQKFVITIHYKKVKAVSE